MAFVTRSVRILPPIVAFFVFKSTRAEHVVKGGAQGVRGSLALHDASTDDRREVHQLTDVAPTELVEAQALHHERVQLRSYRAERLFAQGALQNVDEYCRDVRSAIPQGFEGHSVETGDEIVSELSHVAGLLYINVRSQDEPHIEGLGGIGMSSKRTKHAVFGEPQE